MFCIKQRLSEAPWELYHHNVLCALGLLYQSLQTEKAGPNLLGPKGGKAMEQDAKLVSDY
jgi:hypothetical protein